MKTTFIPWLEERCAMVNKIEAEAAECIAQDNITEYRAKMLQKAKLLSNIAVDAESSYQDMPKELQNKINNRLQQFAQSAKNAIGLKSVFYMSALLFPEEHIKGQPNDLEIFYNSLK